MILNPENVYLTTKDGKNISLIEVVSNRDAKIEIAYLSLDRKVIEYKPLEPECLKPINKYVYKVTIDGKHLYIDKDSEILTDNGIPVKVAYMIHGIKLMKDNDEVDIRNINPDKLFGSATLDHIDHTPYNLEAYEIKIKDGYPMINSIFMV